MIVNHEIYGRMEVSPLNLNDAHPFIRAKHVTRSGLPDILVGKCALDDTGGYVHVKRAESLAVQYIPLAKATASRAYRRGDDWDELYCVASLALVEAASRYDPKSSNGFAAFARAWMTGEIMQHRRGEMPWIDTDFETILDHVAVDNELEKELVLSSIHEEIQKLPYKQSFVVESYFLQGLTLQEIADEMGERPSNVQYYKIRGLALIRARMRQ